MPIHYTTGKSLIYKKTNYTTDPKTIELAFLSRRYTPTEIKNLNKELAEFGIADTKLIIRQDSAFNIRNLKKDIMNEVKNTDTLINEKDIQIKFLEKEISENTIYC